MRYIFVPNCTVGMGEGRGGGGGGGGGGGQIKCSRQKIIKIFLKVAVAFSSFSYNN